MLTPTEQDLKGPLADTIGKYYQRTGTDATDRIRLFRLAWDQVGTQFGSRQALYERFFNGDMVQLRQRRLRHLRLHSGQGCAAYLHGQVPE